MNKVWDLVEGEDVPDVLLEKLRLQPIGIKSGTYFLNIQGHVYGYGASSGKKLKDVVAKFEKQLKYAPGKALAWLKKNTELVSGSRRKKEEVDILIQQVREGVDPAQVIEDCLEAVRRYKALSTKELLDMIQVYETQKTLHGTEKQKLKDLKAEAIARGLLN